MSMKNAYTRSISVYHRTTNDYSVSFFSTCGLAEELESGKKKPQAATSACGSVRAVFLKVLWHYYIKIKNTQPSSNFQFFRLMRQNITCGILAVLYTV